MEQTTAGRRAFRRVYTRILLSMLAVLIASLAVSAGYALMFSLRGFHEQLRDRLVTHARLTAEIVHTHGIEPDRRADLAERIRRTGNDLGLRITVILPDGVVIADSLADPAKMENHGQRSEVVGALRDGLGEGERTSATVGYTMSYVAVALKEQGRPVAVVRVALAQEAIGQATRRTVTQNLAVGFALGAILAALGAVLVARHFSQPIQQFKAHLTAIALGDFKQRIALSRPDEHAEVAEYLNQVSEKLDKTFKSLKHGKQRLAAILSEMNEQLFLVTAEGEIFLANKAFCALTGSDEESLRHRPYTELPLPREILEFVARSLESHSAEYCDVTLRSGAGDSGPLRHFRLSSSPVLSRTKGRFRGVVFVFHDMTLVREMENMRREFVANASHELKTPLSAIMAVTETLAEREPADSETRQRFYATIEQNAARLSQLIHGLLDLSEIEHRRATLHFEPCHPGDLVLEVVDELMPAAAAKHHAIDLDIADDVPEVITDRKAFQKIARNLVDNAIKYTDPHGAITVRVATDDEHVLLEVKDNGVGIAAEDVQRVFERFYRVDKARTVKSGGTGLGLAIVKHTVEAMGGTVAVRSAPGQGSTFTIRLPRQPASDPAKAPADGARTP